MPSTILSDNGVSSGSAGLKTTAASDGSLALQTTTAGGTATTALTIDTSQNVGIGTASPAYKLEVKVGSTFVGLNSDGSNGILESNGALFVRTSTSNPLVFGTNTTERARINSSGYFGINTTNPGVYFDVNGNFQAAARFRNVFDFAGQNYAIAITGNGATNGYIAQNPAAGGLSLANGQTYYGGGPWRPDSTTASAINQIDGNVIFTTNSGLTAGANFTPLERVRIDSSGNLLVGTTTANGKVTISDTSNTKQGLTVEVSTYQAAEFTNTTNGFYVASFQSKSTSGNALFMSFGTESSFTERGSITYNRGAGLTVYNTTSDYRAKDIYGPVVDSGTLIDSTPVYMGKMKGATQERPMFIAHETPEYAHTGEKDAVDADGKPVYQQMDASALIPVMWAEIQSLRKRLAAAGI
jgi:hypothetical protein